MAHMMFINILNSILISIICSSRNWMIAWKFAFCNLRNRYLFNFHTPPPPPPTKYRYVCVCIMLLEVEVTFSWAWLENCKLIYPSKSLKCELASNCRSSFSSITYLVICVCVNLAFQINLKLPLAGRNATACSFLLLTMILLARNR